MKLFLIDDERINNIINHKILTKTNDNVLISQFTNAQTAFDQLSVTQPDLVFLDLNMPVCNGWDFLDKMNTAKHCHDVIILTSSVSKMDHQKVLNYSNVVAYIEKPLTAAKAAHCLSEKNADMTNRRLSFHVNDAG